MFGTVTVNWKQLTEEQTRRYGAVYCGICRRIRCQSSGAARVGLSYDMAFLALLHMSLYEPEETSGAHRCKLHPLKKRPWIDNEYICYAADMNVALAYYNFRDDWDDDRKLTALALSGIFANHMDAIRNRWPRQCRAMETCLARLSELERGGCTNPDEPAGVFGELMAELLVYREDLWAEELRRMGDALGRFIYLMDAVLDYDRDVRRGKYNPIAAMGQGKDPGLWEQTLVLTMAKCTRSFEKLPLVADKEILDNILYTGVWSAAAARKETEPHG